MNSYVREPGNWFCVGIPVTVMKVSKPGMLLAGLLFLTLFNEAVLYW